MSTDTERINRALHPSEPAAMGSGCVGGWVDFREREPFHGDSVWLATKDGVVWLDRWRRESRDRSLTHWKPAAIPEPPKREPTQAELDENMIRGYLRDPSHDPLGMNRGMCAALAWEREQIKALLRDALPPGANDELGYAALRELWHKLANRVGL